MEEVKQVAQSQVAATVPPPEESFDTKLARLDDAKRVQIVADVAALVQRVVAQTGQPEADARKRAEVAVWGRHFPSERKTTHAAGKSGKREALIANILWLMEQERRKGRTSLFPFEVAAFLDESGLRTTKLGKPDARSVGDALGREGLRLEKTPGDAYPIPKSPMDFLHDPSRGIVRPAPEDATLEALCKRYGVATDEPAKPEVTV